MTDCASQLKQTFGISHPELLEEVRMHGSAVTFLPGNTMIDYGAYIKTVPLVVSGSVKVIRGNEEGNEVFLYYLQPGETCAMSLPFDTPS